MFSSQSIDYQVKEDERGSTCNINKQKGIQDIGGKTTRPLEETLDGCCKDSNVPFISIKF
jgi:hypothetical protein